MQLIASSTLNLAAIPTQPTGMTYVTILLMLILRLLLYPEFVLCTKRYVLLTS
jgi:hypothetical protein